MTVPPTNVKVYDRPERKGPSPLVLVIALVVLAVIGYFIYRAMHRDTPAPAQNAQPGLLRMVSLATPESYPLSVRRTQSLTC
jgi:hypothetical protein